MPEVIETWPTSPRPNDPLVIYLDGQIYVFDPVDADELGYGTDRPEYTGYPPHSLFSLRSALQLTARAHHGSWQTRSLLTRDNPPTLTFQFTGLQTCRSTACDRSAVPDNHGYCEPHSKEVT